MANKRNRTKFLQNAESRGCETIRKRFFYRALLIGFLAVSSLPLHAQDTDNMEFWFVAPDASKSHEDRPTFLMITTGDKPADVTISMPKNPDFKTNFPLHTDTTRTIPANSYWKFEFNTDEKIALIENDYTSSGTVTNKGILITSTTPVSAYYQIEGTQTYQREIFTFKGKKALGEEFYMPFQTAYPLSARTEYRNEQFRQIQIVATRDSTTVTINPTGPLAIGTTSSTPAGATVTRTLQKGETLLWRGHARTTNLTGSHITSDQPIAVTLFEDCVEGGTPGGSADPIGDQMVPVNRLGQNYIVVKGYSSGTAKDHALVLAVKEGTTEVWLGRQGQTETRVATLTQQGQSHLIDLGNKDTPPGAYYIRTTQPVYCMHQSATGTEVGGALLPSLYSISGRSITFMKGTLSTNAIFLVFRESAREGFTLDGQSVIVGAQPVGFGDWRYAKVNLTNTTGAEEVCTIANSKGSFALGYFNGTDTGTSLYGYLSAFGTFSFESDTIYHCGNSYPFDAPYAQSYQWTLPDNTTSTASRIEAKQSGRYILKVNQDPHILTDTTYLKLQNFNHILSAPGQLLQDKSYNFTIELNPQKDPDNYFKATYEWNFGDGASVVTSHESTVEVFYSTPGTKTVTLKIENYANYPNVEDYEAICDTIITRTITVPSISEGEVMYWKTGTENRNWNDVNNWAKDADGNHPILAVPSKHTRVYLPGNAVIYPSLKDDKDGHTDWTHYGQPEAKEIVFRYGSELYYQHKLKYEKAFVNYNWGYYGNDGADADGQPQHSWENAKKLKRNTWHILAAPLKSMATGDFSLTGYPFSWQKRFSMTTPEYGGVLEGGFTEAFPANDIPLANVNNAIAVNMAGYKGETGYSNHQNLEGLKGVIEIPYFENDALKPYYPGHNYDVLSKKSYFYYFDTKSLKLINSPVGSMDRAGEAYRFIYETDQDEPPVDGVYEMPLNTSGLGSTNEVMVGNPLLAPIDAKAFADVNRNDAIVFDQGYKLLSDDGLTWQHHSFTEGNAIPAWKAFIVTLQPGASSLSFHLEEVPALKSAAAAVKTRTFYNTIPANNALSIHVLKEGVESADHATLQNSHDTNNTEIRKMILPEGHEEPEIFFMSSGRDLSYLIKNLKQGEKEIPVGVKTSDTRARLSLEFRNVPAFTASTGARAVLVDKQLNIRQNLALDPVYAFTQHAEGLDRQYVDKHRFALQLGDGTGIVEQEDTENGIHVMYRSGILEITSDENIDTVLVYDMYGRLVFSARSINFSRYSHPVAFQKNPFLVQVKTVSGTVRVKKIMGY